MNSIIEYLEFKANSEEYKDRMFFSNGYFFDKGLTFKDLNEKVDERVNVLLNNYNFDKNYCVLLVNNSEEDIITFLALLKMKIKPILMNINNSYDYYLEYKDKDSKNEDDILIMPIDEKKPKDEPFQDLISINTTPDIYDNDGRYHPASEFHLLDTDYNGIVNKYIDNNDEVLYSLLNDEYDFAIPTSGTTGKNKLITIKEKDLIETIKRKYDLEEKQNYIGFTPISAVSGLIFSIYLPVLGENITTYSNINSCNEKYTLLLPGNYHSAYTREMSVLRMMNSIIMDQIVAKKDYKDVEKIIFLGEKATYKTIEEIQNMKDPDGNKVFNENIIWNYYGRTENLGIVSKINEKDIKPVYIYYSDILENRIIYSFNKEDVFELTKENNKTFIKKSDIKYNEHDFYESLPIALINNDNEDIRIKDSIFNEIIAEGKETGDYGFELDGKIYYLCRRNELLKNDNKYFYVSGLEEKLSSRMNEKELRSRRNYTVKQKCFCIINKDNNINIYIPCRVNYSSADNFKRYFEFYKDFKDLIPDNIKVDDIVLIDRSYVPLGREVGKIKRQKLLDYKSDKNCSLLSNDTFDFKKVMAEKLGRNDFEYKDGEFIFSRKNFKDIDEYGKFTTDLSMEYKICEYRGNSKECRMVIDDSFLFACKTPPYTLEERFKEIIYGEYDPVKLQFNSLMKSGNSRSFFLLHHKMLERRFMRVKITKENEYTIAILEPIEDISKLSGYTIDNPDVDENGITTFDILEEDSQYYKEKYGDENYRIKYKMDENYNFYLNDKLFDCTTYEGTVIDNMRLLLEIYTNIYKKLEEDDEYEPYTEEDDIIIEESEHQRDEFLKQVQKATLEIKQLKEEDQIIVNKCLYANKDKKGGKGRCKTLT